FEVGDANDVLSEKLSDRFDAVVLFEGLEHLADPADALAQIEDQAKSGTRFVLSIPNSKTFDEENPFHVSDYSYKDAVRITSRFADAELLFQFVAEGSLLRASEVGDLAPQLVEGERGEVDYANNFVICINCDAAQVSAPRLQPTAAPAHTRSMRSLEVANAELRRANARLSRNAVGVADSAGAAVLAKVNRLTNELDALRAQLDQQDEKRAHDEWIADLHSQIEEHRKTIDEMA